MKRLNQLTMVVLLTAALSICMTPQSAAGQSTKASFRPPKAISGQGGSGWVRVTPADKEFTLMMPGVPKVGEETLSIGEKRFTVRYYGHLADETVYAVLSVSGLESSMADLAHLLMLNLYNKLVPESLLDESEKGGTGVKAVYRRVVASNAHDCREYDIRVRDRAGLWRLYRTGNKFYAVAASTTRQDYALVNRFLNSFKLPPPTTGMTNVGRPPAPRDARGQRAEHFPPPSGTWFVVLRTFSRAERAKANQQLDSFLNAGLVASVVNTDDYPNLRDGFLAVVMGPYSRARAYEALKSARAVAPGAYVKPGL